MGEGPWGHFTRVGSCCWACPACHGDSMRLRVGCAAALWEAELLQIEYPNLKIERRHAARRANARSACARSALAAAQAVAGWW